jgi:cysteinyl-tRNA synthetase
MAPIINSIKDGLIAIDAISSTTIQLMKEKFKLFLEDIFGLQNTDATNNETLKSVMQLLIDIRKDAKTKKDYATSDKIRIQLNEMGILLKDEKNGEMSWSVE